MRQSSIFVATFWTSTTAVYGAGGPETGSSGILLWLFLLFIGAVVVLQLLPGIVLFASMLKDLLVPAVDNKSETKKP